MTAQNQESLTETITPESAKVQELPTKGESDLIYGLEDRPPPLESIFIAIQHVLASFVGVITPGLIICNAIGLPPAETSYIVSMALFVSGIGTFIQTHRVGPVGSGLLSLQGTGFSFLSSIVGISTSAVQAGRTPQQALALIFGVCFYGAFIEIFLSRFLHLAKKIITPVVSGTVVMIIGLSLIKTGFSSIAGGSAAQADGTFGSWENLALGGFVLALIVALNMAKNRYLRMGAIAIGLITGYIIAIFLGKVDFSTLSQLPVFRVPVPFRYGMTFEWSAFLPFMLLFLLTAIESIGDLTATSSISGEPVEGSVYMRRIKGGVLGDGCNSLIASIFNTFPVTTFSQNNGVIKMTGVGSRYVGFYVAGIFALLGLLPVVGGVLQTIPQSVLGGATMIIFSSIALAGMNIVLSTGLDRRSTMIVATSLALGLGIVYLPEVMQDKAPLIKNVFSSGVTMGGLTALILNLILPRPRVS